MGYYYYPLCTKDFTFENIFASESISPHFFYPRRGFGIDYFYKIPKFHHENAIVLFDVPPIYETGSDNSNIFKFLVAVDKESLDKREVISLSKGIIAYKKTIYLDRNNFKILFFSDTEKKVICLRSETSLPTKVFRKYHRNFEVISEIDCRKFDVSAIKELKIDIEEASKEIFYDSLYNSFKGFVYGVIAGRQGEKSKEEIAIKRNFQEVINCFSELRNRKETEAKGLGTRYAKTFGTVQTSLKIYYDKLIHSIAVAEKLFYELLPPLTISEEDIAKYLLETNQRRLHTLEQALQYLSFKLLDDELFGTVFFQQIKTKYLEDRGKEDASHYFETLRILAETCFSGSSSVNITSSKRSSLNIGDNFKDVVHQLSKLLERKVSPQKKKEKIPFEAIDFNPGKNEIIIHHELGDLTAQEAEEYQIIINIILKNPKVRKGELKKEQILKIVELTGEETSKSNGGKHTRLYRYLNNEINDYSVEKASSIVMKNFVAFVFNDDSLEALENYTEVKGIDKKWVSSSFWCLFNGFANVPGYFVKPIFDSDDENLQNEIGNYLKKVFPRQLNQVNSLEAQPVSEPKPTVLQVVEERNEASNKLKDFYNNYLKGKFDIDFEKFIFVFQKKTEAEILKDLKSLYKISKTDGKRLIEQFNDNVKSSTLF